MPLPDGLDFDFVINHLLSEMRVAVQGWTGGQPRDEVAFMNRLTERLARNRHGCDVGVNVPVNMRTEVAVLHRQGTNQTDQYGADLAVTIDINDGQYVKTALFQFKKSETYRLSLERRQLQDAMSDPRTATRSFIFAVDEVRSGIRIKDVKSALADFSGQETRSFDASTWSCLTQWVLQWFSCDVGPISLPREPNSVEGLLEKYTIDTEWASPWATDAENFALPEALPARVWLLLRFVAKEKPKQ